MALRIVLTDGDGVQGLSATFGALIQTNIVQTAADAAAAAQSALNAAASATNSATSAASSAASASSAATQASNAAGSASAAAGSATAAGNSATTAAILANAASGSATAASTSATNAANSATAAGTSATNASNSATAAANSASAAAATLANALVKNADNTVTSASPALIFKDSGQTGGAGIFRMRDTSNVWNFQRNTAAAGDFSTLTTPLQFGSDDILRTSQRPLFNGNTPWDSGNLSGELSGRNRIINGACTVSQRAAVTLATTAGTLVSAYGGPDRYLAINSAGGSFTQSSSSMSFGGRTYTCVQQQVNSVMTDNSGANYWAGIFQIIEGLNVYDLIGKPVQISFIFQSSQVGNYTVAIRDGTNTYSYVTIINVAVANTAQNYTISVPAIPFAATIPRSNAAGMTILIGALNTGTFQTNTLNTWQTGSFYVATGVVNWGLTAGAIIKLSLLQVEGGTVATPFEFRPIAQELLLCYRYFQQMLLYWQTWNNATGVSSQAWNFPVSMRGNPGVTLVNPSYSNASALTISSATTIYLVTTMTTTTTGASAASSNVTMTAEF